MDLSRPFVQPRLPRRIIYAGETSLAAYQKNQGKVELAATLDGTSISDLDAARIEALCQGSVAGEVGVILNSSPFIFNIFEFEKIPWRLKQRTELLNWKVRKIFPDDIGQFHHSFFQLDRNRILSLLLRKNLPARIETSFEETGYRVIFLGNSTVEIMNSLFRRRNRPDCFIEMDDLLTVAVFQQRGIPLYVRKFTVAHLDDRVTEITTTLRFVADSYGLEAGSFSLVGDAPEDHLLDFRKRLSESGLREFALPAGPALFFPGIT